jgi:hypothetical protein
MANSDKNILITPNIGQTAEPRIVFTGSGNSPITMKVLDSNALSFEGSAGQLFSITNSLTGTLFSVNDISGIPSIDVADTGLVRLVPYNGNVALGSVASVTSGGIAAKLSVSTTATNQPGLIIKSVGSPTANLTEWQDSTGAGLMYVNSGFQLVWSSATAPVIKWGSTNVLEGVGSTASFRINPYLGNYIGLIIQGTPAQTANLQEWRDSSQNTLASVSSTGAIAAPNMDIAPLDNLTNEFNGLFNRFLPRYAGSTITVSNPFRLMVSINGIIQSVYTPEFTWQGLLPRDGFYVDSDGFMFFSEAPVSGSTFDGRLLAGQETTTKTTNYPFRAVDLLLGA